MDSKIIQQSKTAAELGDLILQRLVDLVREQNGWTVDPKNIPEELHGMLTSEVRFDDTDDMPVRMVK
jgi:hypothetical protein